MKIFFSKSAFYSNNCNKWMVRPPVWARLFLPGTTWRLPVSNKEVFLTFDDGPVPEVTPLVIKILEEHGAKGTFFCVGDNILKHQSIYQLLLSSGMGVGNHTLKHNKAWSTPGRHYLESVNKCQQLTGSKFFRPPHGQLYPWTVYKLREQFDKVVMWDLLSMDHDEGLTADDVANNVINNVRPGSIIVFHDSLKAWPRLGSSLPKILKYLSSEGYQTSVIR